MLHSEITLNPEALKFIGALKYDPGFILLCDLLQSQVDSLTDELADPSLPAEQLQAKLGYWRAMRTLLAELKLQPENFAHLADAEPSRENETEMSGPEMWALTNPLK